MIDKDYILYGIGFVGPSKLADFLLHERTGKRIDVTVVYTDTTVPLRITERIFKKYGEVIYTDEYGTETIVHSVIRIDGVRYLMGHEKDEWNTCDMDNDIPDVFIPVSEYAVDKDTKTVTGNNIRSGANRTLESVEGLSTVSRFGGYPVDSTGKEIEEWPHFQGHPLIFQAQKQLPDGRMVWVFANVVTAIQTVLPIAENPAWENGIHYKPGMSGAEYLDIHKRLYGRDQWHYDNKEFIGQSRPIYDYFNTWNWEDSSIAVIVEGGTIPAWITMKNTIEELKPFLTVSEPSFAFPKGELHTPYWIQSEREDGYNYPHFIFQIDDGVGGIEYDYGDLGSLYVYWNGKDAGAGIIQCY